jgi:hypothetical protein
MEKAELPATSPARTQCLAQRSVNALKVSVTHQHHSIPWTPRSHNAINDRVDIRAHPDARIGPKLRIQIPLETGGAQNPGLVSHAKSRGQYTLIDPEFHAVGPGLENGNHTLHARALPDAFERPANRCRVVCEVVKELDSPEFAEVLQASLHTPESPNSLQGCDWIHAHGAGRQQRCHRVLRVVGSG